MNVAEQLDWAAADIEVNGWWSGDEASARAPTACPITALRKIRADRWVAHDALAEFIGKGGRRHEAVRNIYTWNDAPGQTKENVIATMRACAAIWRAKQENTDASKAVESNVQVCERGSQPEAGIPRGEVRDRVQAEASA